MSLTCVIFYLIVGVITNVDKADQLGMTIVWLNMHFKTGLNKMIISKVATKEVL